MGNCSGTQKNSTADILPYLQSELNQLQNCAITKKNPTTASILPTLKSELDQLIKGPSPVLRPVIKLYGPENIPATFYIRFALLYKPVSVLFTPSEIVETPVMYNGSDVVSGTVEELMCYLDSKFPDPPLLPKNGSTFGWYDQTTPLMVWLLTLQHRSMTWHLERMERWAEDMVVRGGKTKGDPVMGSPRMEMKKFAKGYSQLLEVLLEHARMEERVVFPILEKSDRDLSKAAREEHARDLPVMNGINEDIKSIGVLAISSPIYQEALLGLATRLKSLKEQFKQHFEEEEKELLPYMEAIELSKGEQGKVLEECLDAMRETHSNLFRFFLEGLRPQDGMQYLDMIIKCSPNKRATLMLHLIVA